MTNITGQRRKPKLPSAMDEDDDESESDSSSDEDEDEEEMAGQSDQAPQSKKPLLQVRELTAEWQNSV